MPPFSFFRQVLLCCEHKYAAPIFRWMRSQVSAAFSQNTARFIKSAECPKQTFRITKFAFLVKSKPLRVRLSDLVKVLRTKFVTQLKQLKRNAFTFHNYAVNEARISRPT